MTTICLVLILLAAGGSAADTWDKAAAVKAEQQTMAQVTHAVTQAEIAKQVKRQQAYADSLKRWKVLPKRQQANVKKPVWTETLLK